MIKVKKKTKKCLCCKTKDIENKGHIKYCNHCSLFVRRLSEKIGYYKKRVKELSIKIYGQKKGSERVR